jgi:hypothetical protein
LLSLRYLLSSRKTTHQRLFLSHAGPIARSSLKRSDASSVYARSDRLKIFTLWRWSASNAGDFDICAIGTIIHLDTLKRALGELRTRSDDMVVSNEQLLERPLLELRTCPSCLRFASFSHTDIRKNQIFRIYECLSGRQFSDSEEAKLFRPEKYFRHDAAIRG